MEEEARRILPKTGYPRRRAVAACLTCRERKRKCDNLRPICSACRQIGATCEYTKQDASAFDAASLRIIEHLSVIEGLVRDIHPSSSLNLSSPAAGPSRQRHAPVTWPSECEESEGTQTAAFSVNLDVGLKAATDRILQWPIFDELLSPLQRFNFVDFHGSETYTYLDDLANLNRSDDPASRSIVNPSTPIRIATERVDVEPLVDQFFRRVNIKNPILRRRVASQYCEEYYENGPQFSLETCLVLLMCALGTISMDFDPSSVADSPESNHYDSSSRVATLRLAHCYFVAAEKRLGAAMSSSKTLAIQCLCLAGIYHMYAIKPMSALRMFHAAGSLLQILVATWAGSDEEKSQTNSSLFWTCYKSEREILAEIPISAPALREPGTSGSYPPPPQESGVAFDEWAASEEDSWYFLLSEIALRRITDQVAEVVAKYIEAELKSEQSPNIEELIPIVAEFERQAEGFRGQLPPSIQFPDVPQPAGTEWQQYSRGRYYRVLELMHRPFLFTAIHDTASCSPVGLALAQKGLFNALRYLQHSHANHRHHGLWLQLRNQLKAASLLLAASRSGALAMPEGWQAAISKTLTTFDYWSLEFSSCKTYSNVILHLAENL